jgi:hypothetical protein
MTFDDDFKNFLWGVGNDLVNELVDVAPVDTGQLKNSIDHRTEGDTIVISMAEQGLWCEFGTPPHIIRVKEKKVLSDGKVFFGKEVHHPGTRPNPFIRTTMQTKLSGILQDNVERHLK